MRVMRYRQLDKVAPAVATALDALLNVLVVSLGPELVTLLASLEPLSTPLSPNTVGRSVLPLPLPPWL
jgi:hypothetical protein